MCYIHYFNTNVQQNKKEKNKPSCFSTHLSLQYNTYSSLAADILGLSALFHYQAHIGFRSDTAGLYNNSMLTCCLTAHELRTPCYVSKMPSTTTTAQTAGNVQVPTFLNSAPTDSHSRLTWWWNESWLYRRMQTLGPYSFSAGIEQAVYCWDKCPTGCWLRAEIGVTACLAYLFRSNIPSDANQLTAQMVPLNSISMHQYEPQVWFQSCLNEHTYTARSSRNNEVNDTVVNRNGKKRNVRDTGHRRRAEMRKETVEMGFGG